MSTNINITNSTIDRSVIGEKNRGIFNGEEGINWEQLQNEWLNLLRKLPNTSEEFGKSSRVFQYILTRNREEFVNAVKTFAISFSSSLFADAASPFLTDFIKKVINS